MTSKRYSAREGETAKLNITSCGKAIRTSLIPGQTQRQLSEHWKFFGSKFSKEEVIYFCQVFIVYIVVISSIVNLYISDRNTSIQ